MSDEIYKKLAKHLSSLGMGYPEKEELLEILRENFTPLEAEVALAIPTKVIPFELTPASEIIPPQNISKEELESILSNLAQRGLLFSKKMKDGVIIINCARGGIVNEQIGILLASSTPIALTPGNPPSFSPQEGVPPNQGDKR
jgi:hypothetical protein